MARMAAKCPACGEITALQLVVGEGGKVRGEGKVISTCSSCGKQIETVPADLIRIEE